MQQMVFLAHSGVNVTVLQLPYYVLLPITIKVPSTSDELLQTSYCTTSGPCKKNFLRELFWKITPWKRGCLVHFSRGLHTCQNPLQLRDVCMVLNWHLIDNLTATCMKLDNCSNLGGTRKTKHTGFVFAYSSFFCYSKTANLKHLILGRVFTWMFFKSLGIAQLLSWIDFPRKRNCFFIC